MPVLVPLLVAFGGASLTGMALGLTAWLLAEYLSHRFLFHCVPGFRGAHDEHHARPAGRTYVTSWHSLAIFGALFLVVPAGVLAGLALGHLAYITAHHAVHHRRVAPGHPLSALRMRHATHHRGIEASFGVVTTAWDRMFRT